MESVVLLVVVGTHFISTEVQLFGVEKKQTFSKKRVCKVKNFIEEKKGMASQKVEHPLSQN